MPIRWDGAAEFKCTGCGSRYRAHYKDFPAPDPRQTFNCTRCGTEVLSWKGTRDYMEWELIEPA